MAAGTIVNFLVTVCTFILLGLIAERGAVVEWLERLGYGAESRR